MLAHGCKLIERIHMQEENDLCQAMRKQNAETKQGRCQKKVKGQLDRVVFFENRTLLGAQRKIDKFSRARVFCRIFNRSQRINIDTIASSFSWS